MKLSSHKHKTLQWIKRSEHFYKNSINSETEKQTIIIEQMVFCNKWIEKKSKWTNWSDQISVKISVYLRLRPNRVRSKKKEEIERGNEVWFVLTVIWKEGGRERGQREICCRSWETEQGRARQRQTEKIEVCEMEPN